MIDIHNKNYIPALEEMVEYINNPVFLLFCNDVKTKYNCKEQIEFSSCSWEYGWNVKFKKSGKTLCTIYPRENYFTVLVVVGKKEKDAVKAILQEFNPILRDMKSKHKGSMTIAICNQKGGVGKTTTTVNLGVGLAMQGKKVLLVDADPQGDLTTCLGWRDTDNLPIALPDKMVEVMQDKCKEPTKGILHHKEGVDLIPSNSDLFDFEISLVTAMNREAILRNYLNEVKHNYDYIIIDCSPSLGMMTLNALSAADSVIIPVQAHYLPAKCMTQLMRTITKVKKHINPKLSIDGILLTLVDNRTNLAKSTIDALRENFGSYIKIYNTHIPIAIKAAEVSSKGKSIYAYEPNSTVSKAYTEFSKEVLADGRKKERLHSAQVR